MLEVERLSAGYGAVQILRDVSLSVGAGTEAIRVLTPREPQPCLRNGVTLRNVERPQDSLNALAVAVLSRGLSAVCRIGKRPEDGAECTLDLSHEV